MAGGGAFPWAIRPLRVSRGAASLLEDPSHPFQRVSGFPDPERCSPGRLLPCPHAEGGSRGAVCVCVEGVVG